ncbi:MAG: dihydroorotase family protein [Promethearchaeota archaeon]
MILKNGTIYCNGKLRKGTILIHGNKIKSINFESFGEKIQIFKKQNSDRIEINCENKLILPGIIDIHSHLRDMGQKEKETFRTGTKAAAFSGITTVFNMPNTIPPAIDSKQVERWMNQAENNIFIDVGFIAGIPKDFNFDEIKKIMKLGVIGFKIYPHSPISNLDWKKKENLRKILALSSRYKKTIFIHPEWPLSENKKQKVLEDFSINRIGYLELHDKLKPIDTETKYIEFVLSEYKKFVSENNINFDSYPKIHFCHISCKKSYFLIKDALINNKNFKISYEVSPHHLLLTKRLILDNINFGKVDPPLRDEQHSKFLFNELRKGQIKLIASDHAPHTLKEKSIEFLNSPSGFPEFETYPLILLDKVYNNEIPIQYFVHATSEFPASLFNLSKKGFIKEGYDADLIIIEKIEDFYIKSKNFISMAKYSPYENSKSSVKISKVLLRGKEINIKNSVPHGKIIRM